LKNIEFAQEHFNEYINSYKYADLIFMYSREQQAAPLPMDPNFANGQILERTVKQKFTHTM
jgi:hypothetical protein